MPKSYIGEGGKYALYNDTIVLPVVLLGLPGEIQAEGITLFRKSEFHVSLVCIGKIIEKHKVGMWDFIEMVTADFAEYVNSNPVEVVKYTGEFRYAKQGEKNSVVAMCEVYNLNNFFDLLNKKYTLALEYPPTHVTLYTNPPEKGIFLADSGDLKTLTKIIPNPGIVLDR